MQAQILLNEVAQQAAKEQTKLNLIAHEKPFDSTHYTATEARRNALYDFGWMIERTFNLDNGAAAFAFNDATLREIANS
jgi:hypothetical protein